MLLKRTLGPLSSTQEEPSPAELLVESCLPALHHRRCKVRLAVLAAIRAAANEGGGHKSILTLTAFRDPNLVRACARSCSGCIPCISCCACIRRAHGLVRCCCVHVVAACVECLRMMC